MASYELERQMRCHFPLTMASQLVWNDYFTVLVTPWPLNPRWPLSAILKIAHLVPRIVNTMLWYHFSPSFALEIHENVSWMRSMDYIGISLFLLSLHNSLSLNDANPCFILCRYMIHYHCTIHCIDCNCQNHCPHFHCFHHFLWASASSWGSMRWRSLERDACTSSEPFTRLSNAWCTRVS